MDLDAIGDLAEVEVDDDLLGPDATRWRFVVEVETSPSAFAGLVQVEVVVRGNEDDRGDVGELARLTALVDGDVRSDASP